MGCRCGYRPFRLLSSEGCNVPCSGNPDTTCGGYSHNEIYRVGECGIHYGKKYYLILTNDASIDQYFLGISHLHFYLTK